MNHNILIIEDNKVLSGNINKYLKLKGIESKQLFEGKQVIYELVSNSYNAIILDLGLPDISGLKLCEKIREKGFNLPILILTARSLTKDKIIGLESGADDYLTKPFEYDELIARLKALIRRDMQVKSKIISLGNIKINIDKKIVTKNNTEIKLSGTEFNLFLYLIQNKGQVLSKENISKIVWGEFDDFDISRKVDVYIGYLRKKLGNKIIKTQRGKGYIIN